jgi:hypothetical protein
MTFQACTKIHADVPPITTARIDWATVRGPCAQLERRTCVVLASNAEAFARIAEEEGRGNADRKQLERIVEDTLYRLGHEPVQAPTVREFLEKWLVGERGAVTERTHLRYSQVVRDFLSTLGYRADSKLTAIEESDIVRPIFDSQRRFLLGRCSPGAASRAT